MRETSKEEEVFGREEERFPRLASSKVYKLLMSHRTGTCHHSLIN